MKINAARVKALVLAALAALAGWAAGNPDAVATLPSWARAVIGFAGAIYATAFVSSTEVKTGDPKGVAGMKDAIGGPMALLLVVGLALALPACPAGCPNPPPISKVAHCSSQAVQDHAIDLLPKVNSCLVQRDYASCLDGLAQALGSTGWELVACVVTKQGDEFSYAAAKNPHDSVSAEAATNAHAYVKASGVTIEE